MSIVPKISLTQPTDLLKPFCTLRDTLYSYFSTEDNPCIIKNIFFERMREKEQEKNEEISRKLRKITIEVYGKGELDENERNALSLARKAIRKEDALFQEIVNPENYEEKIFYLKDVDGKFTQDRWLKRLLHKPLPDQNWEKRPKSKRKGKHLDLTLQEYEQFEEIVRDAKDRDLMLWYSNFQIERELRISILTPLERCLGVVASKAISTLEKQRQTIENPGRFFIHRHAFSLFKYTGMMIYLVSKQQPTQPKKQDLDALLQEIQSLPKVNRPTPKLKRNQSGDEQHRRQKRGDRSPRSPRSTPGNSPRRFGSQLSAPNSPRKQGPPSRSQRFLRRSDAPIMHHTRERSGTDPNATLELCKLATQYLKAIHSTISSIDLRLGTEQHPLKRHISALFAKQLDRMDVAHFVSSTRSGEKLEKTENENGSENSLSSDPKEEQSKAISAVLEALTAVGSSDTFQQKASLIKSTFLESLKQQEKQKESDINQKLEKIDDKARRLLAAEDKISREDALYPERERFTLLQKDGQFTEGRELTKLLYQSLGKHPIPIKELIRSATKVSSMTDLELLRFTGWPTPTNEQMLPAFSDRALCHYHETVTPNGNDTPTGSPLSIEKLDTLFQRKLIELVLELQASLKDPSHIPKRRQNPFELLETIERTLMERDPLSSETQKKSQSLETARSQIVLLLKLLKSKLSLQKERVEAAYEKLEKELHPLAKKLIAVLLQGNYSLSTLAEPTQKIYIDITHLPADQQEQARARSAAAMSRRRGSVSKRRSGSLSVGTRSRRSSISITSKPPLLTPNPPIPSLVLPTPKQTQAQEATETQPTAPARSKSFKRQNGEEEQTDEQVVIEWRTVSNKEDEKHRLVCLIKHSPEQVKWDQQTGSIIIRTRSTKQVVRNVTIRATDQDMQETTLEARFVARIRNETDKEQKTKEWIQLFETTDRILALLNQ